MTSVASTARAAGFLDTAGDYLRSRPAEHSVLLTNATVRADEVDADNLWAWARIDDGTVVAAAMHTPPFGAYVSMGPDDAIRLLAGHLHEHGRELPGVGGPPRDAEAFAAEWARRTGATVDVTMRQGLYVADAVTPPIGVPGELRTAGQGDAALLLEWVSGFYADTGLPAGDDREVANRIATGRLYVWVTDDVPVSMAGITPPVGGVARVQLVYTPKALRRRGYAGACVAALTAQELALPGRTCMLYTDLANPTSNGVYQGIGYRRIGEAVQLAFG
jgi:predicted GNAT family acetyltransferase